LVRAGVWDQENSDNLTVNSAGAANKNRNGSLVLPLSAPKHWMPLSISLAKPAVA